MENAKRMENKTIAGFRLSLQQERVWAQQQSGQTQPCPALCTVLLEGTLDSVKLHQAVKSVVARHEILRTVFQLQPGLKSPFQVIQDNGETSWKTVDLSRLSESDYREAIEDLSRQAQENANAGNLAAALHVTLGSFSPSKHVLTISLSALCADSRSLTNIVGEIGHIYSSSFQKSEVLGDTMQYVDVVEWQNELLHGEDTKAGRDFWTSTCRALDFASLSCNLLPFELKDQTATFSARVVTVPVNGELLSRIESFCSNQHISRADSLLACWSILLCRLMNQTELILGLEFAGRKYQELEDAIGLFSQYLPIRIQTHDQSFDALVRTIASAVSESHQWQESFAWSYIDGFDKTGPVFPFSFDYAEVPSKRVYGDVSFSVQREYVCSERFKLKLSARRTEHGLNLEFHYDSSRLSKESVEQIAGYYHTLLSAAIENPDALVSHLPLLNPAQRNQLLVEWNQTTASYPRDKTFHELFEAQAERTPDRTAVRFEGRQLSYRELNEQANQLAHYLRQKGVGPDSLVGLCLERSAEMMIALLGIMKAGGAYVPLNPDNPKPRLEQQLQEAVALITETKLLPQMPAISGTTVCLGRDGHLWNNQPRTNPKVHTTAENLVYILYTSGSTGVPKGVAVRHRNLVNYSHFITRRLELDKYPDGLHFATVSTIGADLGNTCIFPALMSGGCLHVISYEVSTDSQHFARYTQKYPVDVLKIVPSHLTALLHSGEVIQILPRRYLLTGGETLSQKLVEKINDLGATCEVLNHYGPTETTVGSLTLRLKDYDRSESWANSIPIGRPIANTQVYILDQHLEPVPVGVTGELYIAGAGVTAGYLNQPERTAERFVRNPFSGDSSSKMYRTGDLARYLPDGNVEFLGRGDDQVKIRGFRIELGEIEAVLARNAGVKQAVLLANEDDHGDKRLLAYVVLNREFKPELTSDALRTYLKQQLPDYMVPSAIVILPKLPLTPNGKLDRKALPAPESAQAQTRTYLAPRTPTEEIVTNIWAEVLRRAPISVDDNFFDLGGHSLMATQIVSRVREQFRVEIAMRVLFDKPTIGELAGAIDAARVNDETPSESSIVPVGREGYRAKKPL
ncbi:MAG: hypothetical protein NVS1B11_24730 [Terriglobales bacterium]